MFEISMLGMFFTAFWLLAQPASSTRRDEWWVEVDTDSPKRTYYFGPVIADRKLLTDRPATSETWRTKEVKKLPSTSNKVANLLS